VTRILLLGAAGFLGRHVYDALRRPGRPAGFEVVVAGRRPPPPAFAGDGVRRVHLDLTAGAAVAESVLRAVRPDVVINCAGRTGGDPAELAAVNLEGVADLLEALGRVGGGTRLVHLGSAAEYGAVPAGRPVREDAAAMPVGGYGITKLAATRLVRLAAARGLNAVALRVFNPVGPGAPPSSLPGRVAAQIRRAAGTADPLRLGPLGAYRDFVDARDVAAAVVAAATVPVRPRPVLNVGSGLAVPVRALVDTLTGIAGFDGEVEEGLPGSGRSAEVAWQQADLTAVGEDLGWRPERDLRTSLRDLWQEAACPA
jgi:nucleoside-diphosphate-sugar epimerase